MNRLLILGILIISTAPLFAQAQQPNAAELAQNVVSIISGDKAKTQTYCQILDLSDELDQADQQKDREKAEALSQKINELQKNLAPNTSRCSRPLSTWIQIPKTVRRSCRTWLSSIIPAGNGDVLIRGLTSLGTFRRSSRMGFNRRKLEDQRREAADRPHEVGPVESWRADSQSLSMARSRNYPMLRLPKRLAQGTSPALRTDP